MIRILVLVLFASLSSFAQDKAAFKLFSKEGKPVDYQKMIVEISRADIVLFGELHDNAIVHWLQLQVTKDLFKINPKLILGFEMFEADNQLVLDEYLNGTIEERHLLHEAKVWDNYKNDYKPLIEFAKLNKLKAIATNVPRRYANLVSRKGIDALTSIQDGGKQFIAPLPIGIDLELPGYKSMISSMGSHGTPGNAENIARAQAVKDATMAHFILQNLSTGIFIHYHGAYHSQNFEGIYWYLKKANPNLKIVTIHSVEQEDINKLSDDNKNTADFIICIPSDMTKTY
ncbi:MAG TPA: ChaN family lipoprotein [Cyclobacteriaceae bacterium]|nr:ChaN family lipoprotein [Cyclobacteriaceae bacterium]HRJ83575.1 ChaN family lipoprotein [Cyclobacteriaceae bacterium]